MQNGFDHSQVFVSVIVQRMVFPQASEMGLELLEVADVIGPYPEVSNSLHNVIMVNIWNGVIQLKCRQETHDAIYAFFNKLTSSGISSAIANAL